MDYYQILNIDKDANQEDIKKSYRQLALLYHPDKNPSPDAEEKFKQISEAYQILSDPDKRSYYNQMGTVPETNSFTSPVKVLSKNV